MTEVNGIREFKYVLSHQGTQSALPVVSFELDTSSDSSRLVLDDLNLSTSPLFDASLAAVTIDGSPSDSDYVRVAGVVNPQNWLTNFTETAALSVSTSLDTQLQPGDTLNWIFESNALPGIRTLKIDADWWDFEPTLDQASPAEIDDARDQAASIYRTIGPIAPPVIFNPSVFLGETVSNWEEGKVLGWAIDPTLIPTIDSMLSNLEMNLSNGVSQASLDLITSLQAVVANNACTQSPCSGLSTELTAILVAQLEYLRLHAQLPLPSETTLHALNDSFLRNGSKNRNEGANPRITIRATGNNRGVVEFDLSSIDLSAVATATLVMTIAENANNWGQNDDRTVDVHALLAGFAEGDGQNLGVPNSQSTRGSGEGTTWNCATDEEIQNQQPNCVSQWDGASFVSAPSNTVLHVNGQTGVALWNVSDDVRAGYSGWAIKKTNEAATGKVHYYSKEGATQASDNDLGPRLILTF